MDSARTFAQASRATRLDPSSLPLRFAAPDAGADGGERRILLNHSEVMVNRHVARTTMNLRLPMNSFRGVAIRLMPGMDHCADRICVILAHRDRALDVTLYEADHDADVVAEWQQWATTLGLPLLIEDLDGRLSEPYARMGQVQLGTPRARRRRSFLARRPRFLVRRKSGKLGGDVDVIHAVNEIIARS